MNPTEDAESSSRWLTRAGSRSFGSRSVTYAETPCAIRKPNTPAM